MVSPQEHMCYQDLSVCVGKRHFMYALSDLSKNCTQIVDFRSVPWISLKCKSSCVSSLNLSCTCSRLSVAGSSLVSVRSIITQMHLGRV